MTSMTLRSSKHKSKLLEPNCSCKKYYINPMFDDNCSNCWKEKNPQKWEILMQTQTSKWSSPPFTKKELDDYLNERMIPMNDKYWSALKHMFNDNGWLEENNLMKFVNYIMKETRYEGISAKQAEILTNLYLKKNHGGEWPSSKHSKNLNGVECWKVQHAICGLVIDYWNLRAATHGGIGECYYSNFRAGPPLNKNKLGVKQLRKAPAFNRTCEYKHQCMNHGNHIKNCKDGNYVHTHGLTLWLKNSPQQAVGSIEYFWKKI